MKRRSLWRWLNRLKNRPQNSGFSFPELLATIVISGIASSALMSAMVGLSQADKRESILTETQQDMQKALSYMADDLRQSVYVYDSLTNIPSYLPNFGPNTQPVLVFWKADPIDQSSLSALNCPAFSTAPKRSECRVLRQKRFAYSLVVYYQSTAADPKWKGKSRILRYSLPKYKTVSTLTWSTGFVDPSLENNFPNWPYNLYGSSLQTQPPVLNDNTPQVLVDWVDIPNNSTITNLPTCPNPITNYNRLPSSPTAYNSFFACVRKVDGDLGRNQDITIYLRGNAQGRNSIIKEDTSVNAEYSSKSALPISQTQVTLRGVIDKLQ